MKLRALKLHGFKSFADRTEVRFHEGITAVVGPNGCGKSNISDAVRWVLGEQRPSAIRGAKMEEAIFQGTVNRRPVNRGSVTMEVSNEDGVLAVPFEEVEISRTVYRDGGSEYALNRSPCRLRDVHDLCRDTGLGANAYAVIEARMIDAILSDRADERRGLFEEASGIGKYKDRRKAASRRLERAEIDLQRLEDVIAEVQTKVRSLARQKGRAQKYQHLRDRRLAVEVAVVRRELEGLEERLEAITRELGTEEDGRDGLRAELSAAEARYEELRLEQVEVEKARSEAASHLEEVRGRLVRWERDLAVAEEREGYAVKRLEQIARERREAEGRLQELATQGEEEEERLADREEALRALEERLESASENAKSVRERLTRAREEVEAAETREREVARKGAQLEGDVEAAEAQKEELTLRLDRMEKDLSEAERAVEELASQGDLFSDRLERLEDGVEERREDVAAEARAVEELRNRLEQLRTEEREAADRSSSLAAEVETLERMERDQEGVEPVVRAALEQEPDGVEGILTDFVEGPRPVLQALERYLGALTRALVVRDGTVAGRIATWFRGEWEGGGGLVLLPAERAPQAEEGGSLLDRIRVQGAGAPWVRWLLAGVEYEEADEVDVEELRARSVVYASGAVSEASGLVRVGNPLGSTGVLERRKRLEDLRTQLEAARARFEECRGAREDAEAELRGAEETLEAARARLRGAEDELRTAEAEESAHSERRVRAGREREEVERQLEALREARERAAGRADEARRERSDLVEQEEALRQRREEARESLEAVQEEWEAAREEERGLTVERTRLEGEAARARERLEGLEASRTSLEERQVELDRERDELSEELEQCRALRRDGEGELERLFEERTRAEEALREKEADVQRVADALSESERRVRSARSREREEQERRHQLELERSEVQSRIERIRDRLEGEWGRSLETLLEEAEPVEGEPEELRAELREIVEALEKLGPVNMLAVEEHEEESQRLEFLQGQHEDLVEARDDLRAAIREINQTATEAFFSTFEQIRENFRATFQRLFQGGECDLWLDDPEDPLEAAVEIHASPVGKRTQRIDLLSGGERALTALALLFGIYLVKPSPFCVLDEVDAPLDESNIGRFIRLLQEFKAQTQFVVITHNPRTIEAADWIYGVTMEEPGVSSIVGVRLEEALEAAGSAA